MTPQLQSFLSIRGRIDERDNPLHLGTFHDPHAQELISEGDNFHRYLGVVPKAPNPTFVTIGFHRSQVGVMEVFKDSTSFGTAAPGFE